MESWLARLTFLDRIFLVLGLLGALVVAIRLLLALAGADLEGDEDGGEDIQILSLHGLSTFLMMGGFVGLALRAQSGAGAFGSVLGGLAAGGASLWVTARLLRASRALQSSGTLQPSAAVGCEGTVCLRIPGKGTGRVSVRIGPRMREMDAVHGSGTPLATGTSIRVIRVEGSLAVVRTLGPLE